ncbi:monovalent cation/H+ antiporter subunit A [Novosphingobium sp. 1949]|uniref:Monovalent cation/H+ antiporter subunit A n=1 Tax=Novosphingobium organovorum TaxID=2930092 RepID=A0ABT0BCG4_9SPHN|nr:monovalent cation/H+ antiporter subunit A [Novosphingobium organovorum]MCJ2182743.1 monovalent cation/H+ antiporter subunit A [Novosphingobium organovorum]
MHLVLIAVLPFLGALLLSAMGNIRRDAQAVLALVPVLAGLWVLGGMVPAVLGGAVLQFHADWVPALGLGLTLRLDALALLFCALILFIGLLIVIYARFYLPAHEALGRFLALLLLFQGAMVGISLSGNILLLLVFWELTSLSSFLLIGFRSETAEGRQGARMALTVTGGGGLALIAGLVLLGHIAGTYELSALLTQRTQVQASPLYPLALVLILLGCFTKSAQFPFHFWLPHAMAAPTPVSAYLHSATMVKAGVFLMMRLWPVLAGSELWFALVASTGLVTMLLAAVVGFFKQDLKGILAYSTVSHLGLMTMLLGLGTPAAAMAALFHLLNHALFKAALFMNAGIVDHEAGTRDIRKLGGLATLMPISATLGIIAAASMAGLPPFGGFLSKEMMLEQAADTRWLGQSWLLPMLAVLAAAFSVAYSLRYIVHLYLGPVRDSYPARPHDPPFGLWAPSALLVALTVLVGLFPNTLTHAFMVPAIAALTGTQGTAFHPALWHGWTPALAMSAVAVASGAFLLWRHKGLQRGWEGAMLPDAKALFDTAIERLVSLARLISDAIHNGSLQRQLAVLFVAAVALGALGMAEGGYRPGTHPTLPASPVAVVAWLLLLSSIVAVLVAQQQRFLTLVFISVIGLVVSLAFVYLSAPDLALTQICVETVTILLMLLALNLLPKKPRRISSMARRVRDALIGLAGGGAVGFAAYAVMTREPNDPISAFHWAKSLSEGGGHNVVNVTLVDFRGFDTFGEITVLGIAALTIFALLQPAARGAAGQRLRVWVADLPRSPERHPMMFAVAARVLLPLASIIAIYIFLRGHNAPGGGFIAGLVASIAMLVQYMASGFEWTDARRRIDEHRLIGLGVTIAALTGLGSLVFGYPLFTSAFGHFHIPLLGDLELATATLFDIGVGMTVIGAVMLALAELSHIAVRANKDNAAGREDGPMDIDPARLWAEQQREAALPTPPARPEGEA